MSFSWKDCRAAVTGGAGFIGSNLLRRLAAEGARPIAIDNLERGSLDNLADIKDDVEFRQLDLRNVDQAHKALEGVDVVFHLAAKVAGIQVYVEKPGSVILGNVLIDHNVFDSVIRNGVKRVFYASSSHVYPEHLQQSVDAPALKESDAYPAAPGLSYGWAKLLGEITLMDLAHEHKDMAVSVARICGAYGYSQQIDLETGSLIPVLCHRAARWPGLKPFVLRGTGKEKRSYCFVDDVVEALVRSIEAQEGMRIVGPMNVSTENQYSVHEIAETVVRVSGKEIDIEYDPSFDTPLWSQTVDCTRARELLAGWTASTSLEDGVRRMYEHVAERVSPSA